MDLFLPIIGVLIIFLCLLSFFIPTTKQLREKTQKFTGLGVTMEISILTVFVLMGFILSLSSFFLQYQQYLDRKEAQRNLIQSKDNEIKDRDQTIKNLQVELEELKTPDYVLNLELQSDSKNGEVSLDPNDFEGEYKIGDSEAERAKVESGNGFRTFKIIVKKFQRDAVLRYVRLIHSKSKRKWERQNFSRSEITCPLAEVK
ncbi:MAG TPA: hypothetical protein VFT08_00205 [Pyrinomonadaceae bacterium]|nr:hypothetical protein [Pyrinomonadaceae bacterium]